MTERPQVLVIGDLMLDQYVAGTVDRISPEAPVPVIRVRSSDDGLGGAANVARQITALGGRASLVGVVGADAAGDRVTESCRSHGIDTSGIIVAAGRPTTTKQRITVGRQQVARVDTETTTPVEPAIERSLIAALDSMDPPDVVILSDYAKGVLTDDVIAAVTAAARRWGVPLLADPKHRDFRRYRGATLIKANLSEFEMAVGEATGADPVDAVLTSGPQLRNEAGVDHLIVTLGAGGMVVFEAGRPATVIGGSAREVYDVSGAGDTVIAALAIALAEGLGLGDGASIANTAAGLAVTRRGVSVVTAAELAAELDRGAAPPTVQTDAGLARLVEQWRAEGRRIVFTNGCFDLFHAGHVHLLGEAAALGDVLIVAVDSDESVRRLKGPKRPIIGQADRMAIIGALGCVDAVVSFDSTGLQELIESIRPDVLVKGADYTADAVVGGSIVTSSGGTVALIPLIGDLSTSAVVEKIRDA